MTKKTFRSRQDSNLRGETPLDFESNALTTRPRLLRILLDGIFAIGKTGFFIPKMINFDHIFEIDLNQSDTTALCYVLVIVSYCKNWAGIPLKACPLDEILCN